MLRWICVLCCLLFASVPVRAEENKCVIHDDVLRTVEVQGRPERVAVLFSSFAEMWCLAGGEIAVTVGESVERGFAKEGVLLVDEGAGKTVHDELLLSYAPDLVIGSADIPAHVQTAGLMEKAGIPMLLFRVESLEDYLRVFKVMTGITGNKEAYSLYGENVLAEAQEALDAVHGKMDGKTVLFIRAGSSMSSVKIKGSQDHFAAGMLSEMGFTNPADDSLLDLGALNMESLILLDPDWLFFSLMGNETAAREQVEELLSGEVFGTLSAVREGRMVILPRELFHFKPNQRWGEAYRYLADKVLEEE